MKIFSSEYKHLLYESLQDKVKDKLSNNFISLKNGILDLIEKSITDPSELVNVQNFINDYIENSSKGNLVEFVEDNQIFNFYLKYQNDIDQLCVDNGFFEEEPKKKNILSLYDFVLEGTKFSVIEGMKIIKDEIFTKK